MKQKSLLFQVFLTICISSTSLLSLDQNTIELIFKDRHPTIFLITSTTQDNIQQNNKTKQIFNQAAERHYEKFPKNNSSEEKHIIFVISDQFDQFYTFERLIQHLGVRVKQCPAIMYLQEGKKLKYKFDKRQDINVQNILDFLYHAKNGEIQQFYKSEPKQIIQKKSGKYVKSVVAENYQQYILNSEKEVLVIFYAPWVYSSRYLKLQYQKVAQSLSSNKNIIFTKVNAQQNQIKHSYLPKDKTTPIKLDGDSVPLILFYQKDKTIPPIKFKQIKMYEREADYIVQWVKRQTKGEWIEPVVVEGWADQQL